MTFSDRPCRIASLRFLFGPALVWLAALPARAASGGGEAIVLVIDSRRYSDWRAWWSNLYNESHLGFALLTVFIVPVMGVVLGLITDWMLAHVGINLKSRVLAER
jgi:hypothetical protein